MADLEATYRLILSSELEQKRNKNHRYSLRAYAKFLGVDPTFLSKVLAGKLLLSLDTADKMTKRLKLDTETRAKFLMSAAEEQQCHALYLIDPSLTDCDPAEDEINRLPAPQRSRS